jgi:hypothetical protein
MYFFCTLYIKLERLQVSGAKMAASAAVIRDSLISVSGEGGKST